MEQKLTADHQEPIERTYIQGSSLTQPVSHNEIVYALLLVALDEVSQILGKTPSRTEINSLGIKAIEAIHQSGWKLIPKAAETSPTRVTNKVVSKTPVSVVRNLLPITKPGWEHLESIHKKKGTVQPHHIATRWRSINKDITPALSQAVNCSFNNTDPSDPTRFIGEYLGWVGRCFADAIKMHTSLHERTAHPPKLDFHNPSWRNIQKAYEREILKKQNRIFSALYTACLGLHKLTQFVDDAAAIREHCAAVEEIYKLQNALKRNGTDYVRDLYNSKVETYDTFQPDALRPFEKVLYSQHGPVRSIIEKLGSTSTAAEVSPKVLGVKRAVKRIYCADPTQYKMIFLCPTSREAALYNKVISPFFSTEECGVLVTSQSTQKKKRDIFQALSDGTIPFVLCTALHSIPQEALQIKKAYIVITAQFAQRLPDYPIVKNLIQNGIPVRISSHWAEGTSDSNARRGVPGRKNSSTFFDSGDLHTVEQLRYFLDLTSPEVSHSPKRPPQIRALLGLFQVFEQLTNELQSNELFYKHQANDFTKRISNLFALGVRSTAPEDMTVFLKQLDSLLHGVLFRAQKLIEKDISGKQYARFLNVYIESALASDNADIKQVCFDKFLQSIDKLSQSTVYDSEPGSWVQSNDAEQFRRFLDRKSSVIHEDEKR